MNELIELLKPVVEQILFGEEVQKYALRLRFHWIKVKNRAFIVSKRKESLMTRTVDLDIALEDIPDMPFHDMYSLYVTLFNRPNKCTRKEFYIWQITNSLQELRFGGLDRETRQLLESMDEDYTPKPECSVPVGVELIKKYKGETYKVKVLKNGYEWDNEVFKSLSAIAFKITGRKISGQEFFGVHNGND